MQGYLLPFKPSGLLQCMNVCKTLLYSKIIITHSSLCSPGARSSASPLHIVSLLSLKADSGRGLSKGKICSTKQTQSTILLYRKPTEQLWIILLRMLLSWWRCMLTWKRDFESLWGWERVHVSPFPPTNSCYLFTKTDGNWLSVLIEEWMFKLFSFTGSAF